MFELFFKYPAPVFRNGELVLLSGWPLWALALAMAVVGAIWGAQILRRSRSGLGAGRRAVLWTFQMALAALVLVLVWRPGVRIDASRPRQNVVAVLADTSRSMGIDDGATGVRLEAVRQALETRLLPRLEPRFHVRLYAFAERATAAAGVGALVPGGGTTRLGESLASVLRESRVLPLAAVIVLSDGADNALAGSPSALEAIGQTGIPVHTVGVGRSEISPDLELEDVALPSRVPARSRVKMTVELRHHGLSGRKARLSVQEGPHTLSSRDIVLARGRDRQTEDIFVPTGEAGAKALAIAVDAIEGEETSANNGVVRPLNVVSRRARILYVEGEPRWEMKFVRRAVEEDKTLQLVSLLRASPNKVYRQGVDDGSMLADGFPSRAEELFAFEALVIGSVEATYFTPAQQQMIRDFVSRRGGSALFLGGRHAFADGGWGTSAVADVLPVRLSARAPTFERRSAKAELTADGRDSVFCLLDEDAAKSGARWKQLPDLADHQKTGELKPGAVALLNARLSGSRVVPLLVRQSYGRGQALAFATGGSWRWRMQMPHEDTAHATFWRQLLRGLVSRTPGPLVVSSERSLYADEDRLSVRAEVRTNTYEPVTDARVWATVVAADGARETTELVPAAAAPGLYEGQPIAPRPGLHRVEVHAARGDEDLGRESVVVYREDGVAEGFHREQNVELLRRIAQRTGGRYWTLPEIGALPDEIAYSGAGITTRETLDLWDMPAVFLLALALRAAEWCVRRRGGVV